MTMLGGCLCGKCGTSAGGPAAATVTVSTVARAAGAVTAHT
jgi:hypothetical protein